MPIPSTMKIGLVNFDLICSPGRSKWERERHQTQAYRRLRHRLRRNGRLGCKKYRQRKVRQFLCKQCYFFWKITSSRELQSCWSSFWRLFLELKIRFIYFGCLRMKHLTVYVYGNLMPILSGQWLWNRIHFTLTQNGFCERNYNNKKAIFGSKMNSLSKSLTRWNGYYTSTYQSLWKT